MTLDPPNVPPGLHLTFDANPSTDTRRALGAAIDSFHNRTVPFSMARFAITLHDEAAEPAAGLSGALSWGWLFVEALWVADHLRGQGIGSLLITRAEAHAHASGCHSAWLDTFQARDFYTKLGYETFGVLEDYPPGQSRHFMRKRLI